MVIFHGKLLNNQIYYFFFMAHKPSNYQVIPDHICYLGMIMCTFVCLNHKLHCEQQPEWAVLGSWSDGTLADLDQNFSSTIASWILTYPIWKNPGCFFFWNPNFIGQYHCCLLSWCVCAVFSNRDQNWTTGYTQCHKLHKPSPCYFVDPERINHSHFITLFLPYYRRTFHLKTPLG